MPLIVTVAVVLIGVVFQGIPILSSNVSVQIQNHHLFKSTLGIIAYFITYPLGQHDGADDADVELQTKPSHGQHRSSTVNVQELQESGKLCLVYLLSTYLYEE